MSLELAKVTTVLSIPGLRRNQTSYGEWAQTRRAVPGTRTKNRWPHGEEAPDTAPTEKILPWHTPGKASTGKILPRLSRRLLIPPPDISSSWRGSRSGPRPDRHGARCGNVDETWQVTRGPTLKMGPWAHGVARGRSFMIRKHCKHLAASRLRAVMS